MSAANHEIELEDFLQYFSMSPTALAIKECARLTALRKNDCPGPILDVGCGDGLFASMAFKGTEVWGIDIDAQEGRWAALSRAYAQVVLGDITSAQLPRGFFSTCVANCSLEHVPRIDLALQTIKSALKPGGKAYLFVPNREWAKHMLSARVLRAIGAPNLSDKLCDSIDRVFHHHHLYDAEGWRKVVAEAGLKVVAVDPVLSSATTVAFEAFLLPSIAGWANKKLTTRWTNFPRFRSLLGRPVFEVVDKLMASADQTPTAEFLVIAQAPEAGA